MKLRKILNKKSTLIEGLEYKKIDLNKKFNFYGSHKIDMDCKINELMWWLKIITLILS